MNYEKKYKEALERANEMIKDMTNIGGVAKVDDIQYLFHELAKSEDMMIKEKIIATIHLYYGEPLEDEAKEMLDWLEKQGEQKLYVNDNAKEMFIKALERVEEQNAKGYKLTDCDKNSWWEDFKNYTSCTIEQKSILDVEIPFGAKDSELEEVSYSIPKGYHAEIEDNKVIIKKGDKKSSWSEEDESRITTICTYLQDYARLSGSESRTIRINEYCDWLKSLRPQSIWKPSDEQMEYLAKAITTLGDEGDCKTALILNDLRFELKKLREE